jgi:predicted lipoprotein with Yx(FWY)xxD motif
MKRMLVIPLALGALAACGGTTGTSSGGAGTTGGSTVNTGTPALGTVLTDSQGRTLYYLSSEQGGKDKCTQQQGCTAAWPLLVAPSSGSPTAASGITGTLGVITAGDGTMEVTYNGWPLHTFNNEPAGQTGGQGIMSFGGIWYAATPGLTSTGAGSAGASSSSASPSSPYGY